MLICCCMSEILTLGTCEKQSVEPHIFYSFHQSAWISLFKMNSKANYSNNYRYFLCSLYFDFISHPLNLYSEMFKSRTTNDIWIGCNVYFSPNVGETQVTFQRYPFMDNVPNHYWDIKERAPNIWVSKLVSTYRRRLWLHPLSIPFDKSWYIGARKNCR